MKWLFIYFILIWLSFTSTAQKLVPVLTETINVNSTTNLNGNCRNLASFKLPEGTISFIYRISVFEIGSNTNIANSLLSSLEQMPDYSSTLKFTANLTQYAIQNMNNYGIDWYIFTDKNNANLFYNRDEFLYCKSFKNRTNSCLVSNECLNTGTIHIGIRNGNLTQGLSVYLEVVALTEEAKDYSYSITNMGLFPANFQMSEDGINWNNYSVDGKNTNTFTLRKPQIYFRMQTGKTYSSYTMYPTSQYKIDFNWSKMANDLFTLN